MRNICTVGNSRESGSQLTHCVSPYNTGLL